MQPPGPSLSLDDLARESDIPERTIRSYIARGLLPQPLGRGRASSYGEEHRTRLLFIKAVREAAPYELPLAVLGRLIEELPSEQIARIARGEEGVAAATLGGLDESLLRRRHRAPSPRAEEVDPEDLSADAPSALCERAPPPARRYSFSAPPSNYRAPDGDDSAPEEPGEVEDEVWSTIDVTPRLRISMRGSARTTSGELKRLARRLRAWLSGEAHL